MKIPHFFLIMIMCLLLVSCGGGTTTSKSKNSVSIKLGFESGTTGKADPGGFMVGSAYISGVNISYGTTGVAYQQVDATSAAKNSTELVISDLIAGKTYTFNIEAVDGDEVIVCSGSTDIQIVPNTATEAELECRFSGVQSLELAALNLMKTSASDSATYEKISGFVATDFGVMNGMDREEFISHLLNDESEYIFDDNIKAVNVMMADASLSGKSSDIEEGVYEIKTIYSDGSYEYGTAGFVLENGEWKIKGNGRAHDMEIRHASAMYNSGDEEGIVMLTGVRVHLNSTSAADTTTGFTVSGSGIEESAFTKETDGSFGLVSPNILNNYGDMPAIIPVGAMAYDMVPYQESLTGDGEELTVGYSDSTQEQYAVRGVIPEIRQKYYNFPQMQLKVVDSETYGVDITLPAAYEASSARVSIDAVWGGGSYHKESKLSLADPSFTISGLNEVLANNPTTFIIGVTAADGDMREFSTYYTYSSLMLRAEAGLNGYVSSNGTLKGFGNGGFLSYLEVIAGINTNKYTEAYYSQDGLASGQTLYSTGSMSASPRSGIDGYIQMTVINKMTAGANPYSLTLDYVGYGEYTDGAPQVRMIKGSDDSLYLFSMFDGTTQAKPGVVTVLKLNADMDEILWIKDYHLEFIYPRSFFRGAVIDDSGDSDELVMVLLSDEYINTVLRINTDTGNVIEAKKITLPDSGSSDMLVSAEIFYIPQVRKYALVGNVQEHEGNAYRNRLAVVVLNADFTVHTAAFTQERPAFPQVTSVALDDDSNIYVTSSESNSENIYKFTAELNQIAQTYSITSVSEKTITYDTAGLAFAESGSSRLAVSDGKIYVVFNANGYDSAYNIYRNSGILLKLDTELNMESSVIVPDTGYIGKVLSGVNGSVTLLGGNMMNIMPDMTIGGRALTSAGTKVALFSGSVALDTSFYSLSAFSISEATPIIASRSSSDVVTTPVEVNIYNYIYQ